MKPRSRQSALIRATVALTLPYIAFAMYFIPKFPHNHVPAWFADVLLVWFIANFVAIYFIAKRIAKKYPPANANLKNQPRKRMASVWIGRTVVSYLVLIWSVFFVRGVVGTLRGEYPLDRAIPVGVFLLFFISMFGWAFYRSLRPKAALGRTSKSI